MCFAEIVVWAFILIPVSHVLSPRRLHKLAKFACRIAARTAGARVRVHGAEAIQIGQPYIFIANHTSILDGFVLYGFLPRPSAAFEAAEHFRYPFWGALVQTMGQIPVDRNDSASATTALRIAHQRLAAGMSVLICPEGSRTRDGSVMPFKKGAFQLAADTGVPLMPMQTLGLFEVLRKGAVRAHPGPVELHFGPAFPPPNPDEITKVQDEIRAVWQERLAAWKECRSERVNVAPGRAASRR